MKTPYDFLGELERCDYEEFNFIVRSWNDDKVITSYRLATTYFGALREVVWVKQQGYTYSLSEVLPEAN